MGQSLPAALASGLALAGVLAVGGMAAARFGRGMPHLGVTGAGAGVAVLAGRLTFLPAGPAIVVVVVAAAVLGLIAALVDRRVREVDAPVWPPPLLPDVAVLALGVAVAALSRPAGAIELPLGPLGGLASTDGAVAAGVVGVAAAVLVGVLPLRRRAPGWMVAVTLIAVTMVLGSGSVAVRGEALVPAFGVPDVVGLAVRAAAVGVVARRGVLPGVAAALALGLGESLLRTQLALGDASVLLAFTVLAYALWSTFRAARPAGAA